MGATNHTTNYNLSQFIGTDKPSWLNDYNGDMSAIDTAIKGAADDASLAQTTATNASTTATSAANTASALATQINTPVTGIAAVVSGLETDMTNVQNTIGNTPLTTVAQTLTGAIEEVKGDIPTVTGALALVSTGTLEFQYDGTLTYGQGVDDIYTQLIALFSGLQTNEYIRINGFTPVSTAYNLLPVPENNLRQTIPSTIHFQGLVPLTVGSGPIYMLDGRMSASSEIIQASVSNGGAVSVYDTTSVAPSAANKAILSYEKYATLA